MLPVLFGSVPRKKKITIMLILWVSSCEQKQASVFLIDFYNITRTVYVLA